MEGEGPVPEEWWISRLCDEFHCLPSQAIREWRDAPCGLLETILEFRAYADAKRVYDRAETAKDIPTAPIYQVVKALDFERVMKDRQARAERAEQADHAHG